MKNSKVLLGDLIRRINLQEHPDEIQSMAYIILEELFSITRTDVLSGEEILVSTQHQERLEDIVQRLNNHEPLQHILMVAEFYGRRFTVNSNVLIPRPETEELVRDVIAYTKEKKHAGGPLRILDIGTGSGCISITLALEIQGASLFAMDISAVALDVANKNASLLKAPVDFMKHDILSAEIPLEELDIVVSNPPYITQREMPDMSRNVTEFEPHLALFVTDGDPLIFYRHIAAKASRALRRDGLLEVEINARFGKDVADIFLEHGYRNIQVIRDMAGKERFVKGLRS